MKKILALGMLGLMIAAAFALGTSATFRDFDVTRSVHIDVVTDDTELIDLTPAQPYAYINDEGKLVIDVSEKNPNWPGNPSSKYYNSTWAEKMYGIGISTGASYNFDHMFNVSNHLWENETIVVRLVSSNDNIAFFHPNGKVHATDPQCNGFAPDDSDDAITDVCFVLGPGDALGISMELHGGPVGWENGTITVYAWPVGSVPDDVWCQGGG